MRAHYQASISRGIGTPEANLWASVLHSAMIEGFFGCPGGHYATLAANSQAISFLVAERGEWADSRRRICSMLGIEDELFSGMCRTVFEGGPVPELPGFARHEKNIASQRALYRALMIEAPGPPVRRPAPDVEEPAPKAARPKPAVREPEPPAPAVEDPPTPMQEAIFEAMSQRTSTPIVVNEDDLLYWPVKAPDVGTFEGRPLPAVGSRQYHVMRAAARQRGGNLIGFHRCGDDWEETLHDVAARYDLDLVMLEGGRPVTEMASDTRLFLRRRPSPGA